MRKRPKKIVKLFRKRKDAPERNKVNIEFSEDEKQLLEKITLITRDLQPGNGCKMIRHQGEDLPPRVFDNRNDSDKKRS
jgi:hypothetical protein